MHDNDEAEDNVIPFHSDASISDEDHTGMKAFLDGIDALATQHNIKLFTVVAMFNPHKHYSCIHSAAKLSAENFCMATNAMAEEIHDLWSKFEAAHDIQHVHNGDDDGDDGTRH